jgi:ethanolamine utilization protein EutN
MILARVEGSLVATKKTESMTGSKLLLVRPLILENPKDKTLREGKNTLVAVDQLGSGQGEVVLIAQGSSARLAMDSKTVPVDAVVIGIVDSVDLAKNIIYQSK